MDHINAELDWDHGLYFRYFDSWEVEEEGGDASIGVRLRFIVDALYWIGYGATEEDKKAANAGALVASRYFLKSERLPWINFGLQDWTIDLDVLKTSFRDLFKHIWLSGIVRVSPSLGTNGLHEGDLIIDCFLTPASVQEGRMPIYDVPSEITKSLGRFKEMYPDSSKVAFIMMPFGTTPAHQAIVEAIRVGLHGTDVTALRADDYDYHEQLFPNILTYVYGAAMGFAVFERLEMDDFNPNVSLEVGYMLALGKPVCLLKDKTLKTLQADLVGHLYKAFDPQRPMDSIPQLVKKWVNDREIALSRAPH